MKRLISVITMIALFSSLVFPSFALTGYSANVTLVKTELALTDELVINGVVKRDDTLASYASGTVNIYDSSTLKSSKPLNTDKNGEFSMSETLLDFGFGQGRIEVIVNNKLLTTANFNIVDKHMTSLVIDSNEIKKGSSLGYTSKCYKNNVVASNTDVIYKVEKNGNLIESFTKKTDINGNYTGSLVINGQYEVGDYVLKAIYNGETISKPFRVFVVEPTAISIINKSENQNVGETITLSVSAINTDNSTTDITSDSNLKIVSSNNEVVSIEGNKMIAKNVGIAKVTVQYKTFEDSFNVNVSEIAVDGLTISTNKSSYNSGETIVLSISSMFDGKPAVYNDFTAKLIFGSDVIYIPPNTKLDKFGEATVEFAVANNQPNGEYKIEVTLKGVTKSAIFNVNNNGIKTTLISDKDTYYAGETIKVNGVLKSNAGTVLSRRSAVLQLTKNGDVIDTKDILSNVNGEYSHDFKIGSNYGTGDYVLKLSSPEGEVVKSIKVFEERITSIKFSDDTLTKIKVGQQLKLNVYGVKTNGEKVLLKASDGLTFISSTPSSITFKSNEYAYANTQGAVTITAKYNDLSSKLNLTVEAVIENKPSGSGNQPPSNNTGTQVNVENQTPASGTGTVDDNQNIIIKDAEDAILKVEGDISNNKDAVNQIKAVTETVKAIIEKLDSKNAANIIEKLVALTEKAIDNPNVNIDEAKEMVSELLKTTMPMLLSKNADKNQLMQDTKEAKILILALMEKVIEKASTVEIISENVPASGENIESKETEFAINYSQISGAIAKSIAMKIEMTKVLEESGLNELSNKLDQNIKIKLPEVQSNEDVVITLDEEGVAKLGENKVGLTLISNEVSFKLSVELIKSIKTSITIKSKLVLDNKLTDITKGGKVETLKVMDLSVTSKEDSINNQVELEFSIKDLKDLDLDTLMVGVYEDGVWKKISYELVNDKLIFKAPHFSIYSVMKFNSSFTDISSNWANKYITSLAAKGIVSGKSDKKYDPNGTITRAEFATLLVNHLELSDKVISNYKDVEKGTWYYEIVARASMNDIVAGVKDGNFRPKEAISREDMAVMLAKAYKVKYGIELTGNALPFSDQSSISDYAKNAVYAAKANEIISGYPDNTFRPAATATRAEAATIIYMFLNK